MVSATTTNLHLEGQLIQEEAGGASGPRWQRCGRVQLRLRLVPRHEADERKLPETRKRTSSL